MTEVAEVAEVAAGRSVGGWLASVGPANGIPQSRLIWASSDPWDPWDPCPPASDPLTDSDTAVKDDSVVKDEKRASRDDPAGGKDP